MSTRNTTPLSIFLSLVLGLTLSVSARAADYFTELEIDEIREAQEIERRVEVLLTIAHVRLARLGLVELEDEVKQTGSENNTVTRAIVRIFAPAAAAEMERAREETERPDYENDVSRFNRAGLLRGYHQALEETMDNIDDAYERNRDIRESLELLRDFTRDSIPALREFQAENESEEIAFDDALIQTELALEGAEAALESTPKTERDQ